MFDDFDFDLDFDYGSFDVVEYIDPEPIEVFVDEFGEYYPDDFAFEDAAPIFEDDGIVYDEFDSGEFPSDAYYEQEIPSNVPSVPAQLPRIPQAPGPSAVPKLSLPGITEAAKAVLPFIARSGGKAPPTVRNLPLQYGNPMARPIGAGAYGASAGYPSINRQRLQARPGSQLTKPGNNRMLLIGGGLVAATLLVLAMRRN